MTAAAKVLLAMELQNRATTLMSAIVVVRMRRSEVRLDNLRLALKDLDDFVRDYKPPMIEGLNLDKLRTLAEQAINNEPEPVPV